MMDKDFQTNNEDYFSKTKAKQDSLQDLKLDRVIQEQENQSRECQDKEHQNLHSRRNQVLVQHEDHTGDGQCSRCRPEPQQEEMIAQGVDDNPAGASVSPQDKNQTGHHDQDQVQERTTANQEAAVESGGGVPALVITQAEEAQTPVVTPVQPTEPQRPTDMMISVIHTDPSLSSATDGADMMCSDLLSLKGDSLSLASSEMTSSRMGEDDDSTSVTASSLTSLSHRVQLEPLEKDWMRSSALGNMTALRQLLCQESNLVLKKTALHWAAKLGHLEAVDMMLRSGADVNIRSGYTALHLASIHGHQQVVHTLINTYNAKTNIRDYHGKTAAHYWKGCSDVFDRPDSHSGGKLSRGRRTQRRVLPSLRLSRSRSQGHLSLDFGTLPQSACQEVWDLQV